MPESTRNHMTPILINGQIKRKQTYGAWSVGDLINHDGGGVERIVGTPVAALEEGGDYAIRAVQRVHPQHGAQLEVIAASPCLGNGDEAEAAFLVAHYVGASPDVATQVVQWHRSRGELEQLRASLNAAPWCLHGFSVDETAQGIWFRPVQESPGDYLASFLAFRHHDSGLSRRVFTRLAGYLVMSAPVTSPDMITYGLKKLLADPYRPILSVWGYEFEQADALAMQLGLERSDPRRLAAIAYSALKSGCDSQGHTYLPLDELRQRIRRVERSSSSNTCIAFAKKLGYPMSVDAELRCYYANHESFESGCASALREMLEPGLPLRDPATMAQIHDDIGAAQIAAGWPFPLDSSQRDAITGMLTSSHRLHTLTAGPGRGKTTVMEVFAQLAGGQILFAAPTGKAAKVLAARVQKYGYTSTTVHQMLEPSQAGFMRNEDNPLEARVVIIDEAGMLDLQLLFHVLNALPEGCHLVLMGDRDQLYSVGNGNVLSDVLSMPADHHQLHFPHRNKGGVLQLVELVRVGQTEFPHELDLDADLVLMSPEMDSPSAYELVEDFYRDAVAKVGIESVALLLAHRKGSKNVPGWNTNYFNARLQAALNPQGNKLGGTEFREGDRILVRRNQDVEMLGANPAALAAQPVATGVATWDLQAQQATQLTRIVNGDTGWIVGMAKKDGKKFYLLHLDDGRKVQITDLALQDVDLGYALTVHAGQGSEYQIVLHAVAQPASGFLCRPVLYTAISRAKRVLMLFGSRDHFSSIARRRPAQRNSALTCKTMAPRAQTGD